MAVKMRLKRMGRRHRSCYRLGVMNGTDQRDARFIEQLGWYDPEAQDPEKRSHLDADRIRYWLNVGAAPSKTVLDLLKANGIAKGQEPEGESQAPAETAERPQQ